MTVQARAAESPPDITDMQHQIDALNGEKETAVAAQDFTRAAHLRDECDKLKSTLQARQKEWRERGGVRTVVDAASVTEAPRK